MKSPNPKFNSFNEFAASGTPAPAPTAAPELISVRVRATRTGYIGLQLRFEGDEFTVKIAKGDELPSWMEALDGSIPTGPIPPTQETVDLRAAQAERLTGAASPATPDSSTDSVI